MLEQSNAQTHVSNLPDVEAIKNTCLKKKIGNCSWVGFEEKVRWTRGVDEHLPGQETKTKKTIGGRGHMVYLSNGGVGFIGYYMLFGFICKVMTHEF